MTTQEIIDYAMAKPGALMNQPFGPDSLCIRIGEGGPLFTDVFLTLPWLTLRCEPLYGLSLRERYPDNIRRGWHCPPVQQPYNNTITLDESISDELLREMIDHSYARALASMTRAKRAAALGLTVDQL